MVVVIVLIVLVTSVPLFIERKVHPEQSILLSLEEEIGLLFDRVSHRMESVRTGVVEVLSSVGLLVVVYYILKALKLLP